MLEFLILEALEFLDQIKLELHRDPTGELEGNVLLREGAAITPGLGNQTDGGGLLDPLLGRQGEAVETGLLFKPVEFDGFKSRIIELLPDPQKLDGVPVAQPIADQVVGAIRILVAGNIGDADELDAVPGNRGDVVFQHLQFGFHAVAPSMDWCSFIPAPR
ncbi:hypothetical protein D3C85_755310 [compost metagenome]